MQLFDAHPSARPLHLRNAVDSLSSVSELERGAVFTRVEVVDALLDLAGYAIDLPLHRLRLLEPSVGEGDFLLPAIDRLLRSYTAHGGSPADALQLVHTIRAVEVHRASLNHTHKAVVSALEEWGASSAIATELADSWLLADDFLLAALPGNFDIIVGNPPYVRQERIPAELLAEYRRRYKTIYDRADLYVPFFERSLQLLSPRGRLAFICANRWVKNKYGGPLRELVSRHFHLRFYIDMEGTNAFHSDVIAYPSIAVIERGPSGMTRVARRPEVSSDSMHMLAAAMLNDGPAADPRVEEVRNVVNDSDPWLLDDTEGLALVRALEARFPTLEDAGCRVGIGVATGADRVFIGQFDQLPVEAARKVPLAMARDLVDGRVEWGGMGAVNPWEADGKLADFDTYPRFAAYLLAHKDRIAGRHCAKAAPAGWYRTIDRIWIDLIGTPKLLIPDIKGEPVVALDEGRFYPHHNLYWVVAEDWDLRALGSVLRSSIAQLFIATYSVRMSGGFLRFQAQYLRRIRVPRWDSLGKEIRQALVEASPSDHDAIDEAVFTAYGLSPSGRVAARRVADDARVRKRRS